MLRFMFSIYFANRCCYTLTLLSDRALDFRKVGKTGKILAHILLTVFVNNLRESNEHVQRKKEKKKRKVLFSWLMTQITSPIFWNETMRLTYQNNGDNLVITNSWGNCLSHFHWNLCLIQGTKLTIIRESGTTTNRIILKKTNLLAVPTTCALPNPSFEMLNFENWTEVTSYN